MKKVGVISIAAGLLLAGCGLSEEDEAFYKEYNETISMVLFDAYGACNAVYTEYLSNPSESEMSVADEYSAKCDEQYSLYESERDKLVSNSDMTEKSKSLISKADAYALNLKDFKNYFYNNMPRESVDVSDLQLQANQTKILSDTMKKYSEEYNDFK